MQFLCAPTMQLVDQLGTILSSIVSFEIHYQRPKPTRFLTYRMIKVLANQLQGKKNLLSFLRTQ
jgi:hypothetical protein